MTFNVIEEAQRLRNAIDKCLYKPDDSVNRWEVKMRAEKPKDHKFKKDYKFENKIIYLVKFTFGPFNEFSVIARKKCFRILSDDELVKMIFRALAKHRTSFDFNFRRGKFVKRFEYYVL